MAAASVDGMSEAAQEVVAALQRVTAAADEEQLLAAAAAIDLSPYDRDAQQRQLLQQPSDAAQHLLGVALAAALTSCLRTLSDTPAAAAAATSDHRAQLLLFAVRVSSLLLMSRHCSHGKPGMLWQAVCVTELLEVLPAACERLTEQLSLPPEQQHSHRQQRRQVQRQAHNIGTAAWNTARLASILVSLIGALAQLTVASGMTASVLALAAARLPAAAAVGVVAPLVAAMLLWFQSQHDGFKPAAAARAARRQDAHFMVKVAPFKPHYALACVGDLLPMAARQGVAAATLVAAASAALPFLAAVGLGGLAAAKHQAAGGLSACPLPGAASGGSGSQGSPVTAHHRALLDHLGVACLGRAFDAREVVDKYLIYPIDDAHRMLEGWLPAPAPSSSSSSGSTQLSAASVRLLLPVLAELIVLHSETYQHCRLVDLFVFVSSALDGLDGRQSDTAGDEEALELLLTMVLPAVQHAAAAAAAAATDSAADLAAADEQSTAHAAGSAQQCLQTVCTLVRRSLPSGTDYSIFDSQLLRQHPAAVLGGLEAAVRAEVLDLAAGSQDCEHRSLSAWVILEQAQRSAALCSWLQEAASAQAAGSGRTAREAGANCSRLLGLLVACSKGQLVLANQPEQGDPNSSYWRLVAAEGALAMCALTNRLLTATGRGAAPGGETDSVQQLLSGLWHLLGRNLAAGGSMLAGALSLPSAAGADSEPAAMAQEAASPAGQRSGPGFCLLPQVMVIVQGLQAQLPALSGEGHLQRQLLKPLQMLAAAEGAVETLWRSPAARAEAEAAAAAEAAAGAGAGDSEAVQLCLLRLNPAAAQQLSGSLVAMGGALCAALPTKHACNDPACTSCDKASEQQLVSGKGRVCSACRVARYCCVEHQRRHWRAHRPACKALVAAAAAAAGGGGGQASGSSSKKERRSKAGGGGGGSSRRSG